MFIDEYWMTRTGRELCEHYSDKIEEWWDPEKFLWEDDSWALAKYCYDFFDVWWDPDLFDWSSSWALAEFCSDQFDEWWDAEKFCWGFADHLAIYCPDHFDEWWDPKKFPKKYFSQLAISCPDHFKTWWDEKRWDWDIDKYNEEDDINVIKCLKDNCGVYFTNLQLKQLFFHQNKKARQFAAEILKSRRQLMTKEEWWNKYNGRELCKKYPDKIKEWWDAKKFDWSDDSWYLAQFCSEYFNIWWDSEKYNWKDGSWFLAQSCFKDFNIWWDAEKFNWNSSWLLAKYCIKYFDIWWDPEKFDWKYGTEHLTKYCSEYFNIWWDPEKFNWKDGKDDLNKYCSSKFTNLQFKQLLLHSNKLARQFAMKELERKENDKRRMVGEV